MVSSKIRLIVYLDESEATIQMVSMYLSHHGFEVLGTTDPAVALQLVHQHEPNVVITEQILHSGTGVGFIRKLRSSGFDMPVLVYTSQHVAEGNPRLRDLAQGILHKPASGPDLLEAVERLL